MRLTSYKLPITQALAILSLLGIGASACRAQESSDDTSSVAAAHYRHFDAQAEALALTVQDGKPLTLRKTPLQKFSIGDNIFGSVYLWLDAEKRPAAIGTLGSIPIGKIDTGFVELHTLIRQPLKPVQVPGSLPIRWAPDGHDLMPKRLEDVPPAAQSEKGRLIQMRGIVRDFEADMLYEKDRNNLRLLPQPLYRYPDSSPDHDGAIFAWIWTAGTDPEMLMHVYTQKVGDQNVWFYQPLRFTYRAVELRRHKQEVWRADEFFERERPQQTGAYMTALTQPIQLSAEK